jgi:Tol biopolymer transport system component
VQIFSRDGRHTAFSARDNLKWRMVVDGQAGPEFSDVDDPHFSADGRHVAYKAQTGDNYFVMRDGKPDPTMEVVNGGSLQFSPDGASLAYAAQSSGRWNVVVDGVPGPAFDDVDLLHYSPDGRHLAYVATDSAQPLFLIAGTPIDESLRDVGPIIDPASPAPGYRTLDGNRVRVVVDRQPGPSFDFVLTAPVVCRDGRLEYLAVKRTAGGARQLVRVTIPGFAPAQT